MSTWPQGISTSELVDITRSAVAQDCFSSSDRSLLVHDLDRLRQRIQFLHQTFPQGCLHAVAIKANPVVELLKVLVAEGAGLEAASMEEVHIALAAQCPPASIVFDSPCKTVAELNEALELGVTVNADNFDELARIDAIIDGNPPPAAIGLRVNPVVGTGSIAMTSVAGTDSKFGVRIDTQTEAISRAFANYSWLRGLHFHVGSQGCAVDMLVEAAARVDALVAELENRFGRDRVEFVDIGGGLPTEYRDDDQTPALDDYAARLQQRAPHIFNNRRRLITEFGRAIQTGCGFALSRVEYIKSIDDTPLAVVHLGADMFLRPVYQPELWSHRFHALDADGREKTGTTQPWTIAGPLCFAGDLIARNCELPDLAAGDLIAIRDTGAYTVSMWSRYCSRGMPKIVGYQSESHAFRVLRRRETPADITRFWDAE